MVEVAQPGRQGASLLLVSERSTPVKRPSMVLLRVAAVLTQADKQKLHICRQAEAPHCRRTLFSPH